MDQSHAAKTLDAWCEAERGRAAKVAEACGVTPTTVHNWRRGAMSPRAENCIAIERFTDGAVRAVDWSAPATADTLDVAPAPTLPDATRAA
jgi:DNA-binding transcriptional regulator YdaS (Cro superfamily)